MHKFQRNYRCEFEIGKQDLSGNRTLEHKVVISYPITIQFSIIRNAYSDCNTAQIKFLNVNAESRALLWRDMYQADKYIEIKLYAGYGDNIPLIFQGLTQKCNSYRQSGATEIITEIQANDQSYLFQYGFANMTLAKETQPEDLFNTLLQDIPDIEVGFISDEIKPLKKDTTYLGQTMDIITRDYSKYQVFVDNGNLHILGERDIIPTSENYVITANSGLLGSPIRSDTTIELDMLFEPGIKIGQAVVLRSDSLEGLNGTYKVIGTSHDGTISPVTCERLVTHLSLLAKDNFKELSKRNNYTRKSIGGKGWLRPVAEGITSDYGIRFHPIYKKSTKHDGIDYGCNYGTAVKATQSGRVQMLSPNYGGYGKCIIIDHGIVNGNRVTSLYAHLSSMIVTPNSMVGIGDTIAFSGATGNVTGPHLHFEIRENNKSVNPSNYIGG